MSPKLAILAAAALVLSAGCATTPRKLDSQAALQKPPAPERSLRRPQPAYGSLYTARTTDYFTDLRAANVGDLVVVEIVENSSAKKKNDTKAEKTNEYSAAVPHFFGAAGALRREAGSKTSDPVISAELTSSLDAKAELTKEDTMTSSIGCTVIERLPSGNLVVRGSRELQVNGEIQYITLQGTVRPEDITAANTVYSTQLADAKIYYTGRGVLTDKQKPGWLARLLDHVWPF
jgi:flagellar L-ring protein precursor FlgH